MKKIYLIAFAPLFLLACNNNNKSANFTATALEKDDPQFLALKDTAQNYLQTFIDSLASHSLDSNYKFAVKSDFVENGTHEHMWSVVDAYKDGKFQGYFVDSAFVIKNLKEGDPVTIVKKDLEDWIIYNNKANTKTGDFSGKYLESKR